MADNSIVQGVDKCGQFNWISHQSAQKSRNMESKLLLCGVIEPKRGLCCLNVSKESFNDIYEWAMIVKVTQVGLDICLVLWTNNRTSCMYYLEIIPACNIPKLSKYHLLKQLVIFWTILKYHLRYYFQILLQLMLLPIQITCKTYCILYRCIISLFIQKSWLT